MCIATQEGMKRCLSGRQRRASGDMSSSASVAMERSRHSHNWPAAQMRSEVMVSKLVRSTWLPM